MMPRQEIELTSRAARLLGAALFGAIGRAFGFAAGAAGAAAFAATGGDAAADREGEDGEAEKKK